MTYCIAIAVSEGICFVSDSRTSAGPDNVSTYSKMHCFDEADDRSIVILSAGNLATTQSVITQIKKDIRQGSNINLHKLPHMEEVADYVGELNLEQQEKHGGGKTFEASYIVGGQINGHKSKSYRIYPQGNHITTSDDTPFLQIGESKYGKPILDRIVTRDLKLDTAALCGLVSMDSTMRSNLTVGPPIEVLLYVTDSFNLDRRYRFEEDSEYLRQLKLNWDDRLITAFEDLPLFS